MSESGDENGETINTTHDDQFARIAKNGKEPLLDYPDASQNVGVKIGHRHRRRAGTLDKIQDRSNKKKKRQENAGEKHSA